jgi:hypothetical protein
LAEIQNIPIVIQRSEPESILNLVLGFGSISSCESEQTKKVGSQMNADTSGKTKKRKK